jgi:hypothetical protein
MGPLYIRNLCLPKLHRGEAADYPSCICKITVNEAALGSREPKAAKVSVEAFFGGSDVMIANRGQKYFKQCWQSDGGKGKVDFATSMFLEANHDSMPFGQKKGPLRIVFKRIVQLGVKIEANTSGFRQRAFEVAMCELSYRGGCAAV